jgi:hypothetical protein
MAGFNKGGTSALQKYPQWIPSLTPPFFPKKWFSEQKDLTVFFSDRKLIATDLAV